MPTKTPVLKPYSKANPLTVVVKRKHWLRGTKRGSIVGTLRMEDGSMCCLGFVCRAAGLLPKHIEDHCEPSGVADEWGVKLPGLTKGADRNTKLCVEMMTVNDGEGDPAEREAALIKLGKRIGLAFVFKG